MPIICGNSFEPCVSCMHFYVDAMSQNAVETFADCCIELGRDLNKVFITGKCEDHKARAEFKLLDQDLATPAFFIRELMKCKSITVAALAERLNLTLNDTVRIIDGKIPISESLARGLIAGCLATEKCS